MRLEDGKYYRTRDGRKVGPMKHYEPMKHYGMGDWFFECDGNLWFNDGGFEWDRESKNNLVAEWVDNDHIERTKRMIEVMQAYVDGHPVESMTEYSAWQINPNPLWDFSLASYRIAETPDSINWDHVAHEFKYMARDSRGAVWLFKSRPEMIGGIWHLNQEDMAEANSHTSYRRGTADWKNSLVIRPGCE